MRAVLAQNLFLRPHDKSFSSDVANRCLQPFKGDALAQDDIHRKFE